MRWDLEAACGQWHLRSLPDVEEGSSSLGRSLGVVGRTVDLDHTALLGHRSRFESLEVGENRWKEIISL